MRPSKSCFVGKQHCNRPILAAVRQNIWVLIGQPHALPKTMYLIIQPADMIQKATTASQHCPVIGMTIVDHIRFFHHVLPEPFMIQWEFQDPKMGVLYHIGPDVVGIFYYISLKHRPYIW